MTVNNGAPSGADVSAPSSSATALTSAGRPTRSNLVQSLKAKNAETPTTEPASPVESTQDDGAPRADEPAKTEGDTANLDAGKGDQKPNEKAKEPESVPMAAFKERLAKERGRREKLEAEVTAARTSEAKVRTVMEAALAEVERLTEQLRTGGKFDEQSEELQSLKLQQTVKEQIAQAEAKLREEIVHRQHEEQVVTLAEQMRSEIADACTAFPLVSPAEVRAALRANPGADIRSLAQAKHEERVAFIAKQGGARAEASAQPTTVAKPTGVSKFEPPLNRKGMAEALRHRAKT